MALSYIQELDRILQEADDPFEVQNQTVHQLPSVKKERELEDVVFQEENIDSDNASDRPTAE